MIKIRSINEVAMATLNYNNNRLITVTSRKIHLIKRIYDFYYYYKYIFFFLVAMVTQLY